MSVTLIICLICIGFLVAFCLWSNESCHITCQDMNYEWFKRMKELADSVGEALDQMQKEIDELEAKIKDFEKLEQRIKYLELISYNEDNGR